MLGSEIDTFDGFRQNPTRGSEIKKRNRVYESLPGAEKLKNLTRFIRSSKA
jgi:hypothetical protein